MDTLRSLSNDIAAAVKGVSSAVVAVHARPRLPSTGIVLRPGLVVTAEHTVRVDEEIRVAWADGGTSPATLVARDPGTDLAVLRIAEGARPAADLSDGPELAVGQLVLAVGYGPRASLGIVSAAGGVWRTPRGGEVDRFVRLDLVLYPGFSGGPLVDASGKITGIVTSGLARGLELALPPSTVGRVVDELVSGGRVRRAYLGVGLQQVTIPDAVARLVPEAGGRGLIVVRLEPDGPAMQAGLMLGDVLIRVGETALRDPEDVQAAVAARPVGTVVRVALLRAGAPLQIDVTLGERPSRAR
jgi:S1-C subfamily serine protease